MKHPWMLTEIYFLENISVFQLVFQGTDHANMYFFINIIKLGLPYASHIRQSPLIFQARDTLISILELTFSIIFFPCYEEKNHRFNASGQEVGKLHSIFSSTTACLQNYLLFITIIKYRKRKKKGKQKPFTYFIGTARGWANSYLPSVLKESCLCKKDNFFPNTQKSHAGDFLSVSQEFQRLKFIPCLTVKIRKRSKHSQLLGLQNNTRGQEWPYKSYVVFPAVRS